MNRNVNAISGRLSLRPPQRHSLEILHRITEIAPPGKSVDLAAALAAIRSEFPTVTDLEREFASLCFALPTGVGKTRLMGAFIAYLPVLGLELTATPFTGTTTANRVFFKNVVLDYPLGRALDDGFVKEPAVVTRKNFDPKGMSEDDPHSAHHRGAAGGGEELVRAVHAGTQNDQLSAAL